MSQDTPTADNPMVARMKDAAYERWTAEERERREVSDLVLGPRSTSQWTGDMVKLGDDWLVEICERDQRPTWTTMVDGQPGRRRFADQDGALLHLLARRYEGVTERAYEAAKYAARVLSFPDDI